jgi:hypothetical protein
MLPHDHARFLQDTQRERAAVNQQVVRLLRQKTVPLNRDRYLHLQKISKAVRKEPTLKYSSSALLTLPVSLHSSLAHPRAASTRNRPMFAAGLLLRRLSNFKDHHSTTHLALISQQSH